MVEKVINFDIKKYNEKNSFNSVTIAIFTLFSMMFSVLTSCILKDRLPEISKIISNFNIWGLIITLIFGVLIFLISEKNIINKINKGKYRISKKDFFNINIIRLFNNIMLSFGIYFTIITIINVTMLYLWCLLLLITMFTSLIIIYLLSALFAWFMAWKNKLYNEQIKYKVVDKNKNIKPNNKLY